MALDTTAAFDITVAVFIPLVAPVITCEAVQRTSLELQRMYGEKTSREEGI
jgi:hypothetical protein